MLGVSRYSKDYIDATKLRVKGDVAAYEQLVASAKSSGNGFDAAREAFESRFYNSMVLALENSFVHRLRTVEGKDGNPLNEVRVLCQSILEHGGVMPTRRSSSSRRSRSRSCSTASR